MVFCYTDLQLTFVYLGAMATCFFGFFIKWLFDCFKDNYSNCRKSRIAKPSREFYVILEEMRNYIAWDVSKETFKVVLRRFATKIENAVAGEGMRNCDRFDNWEDAMDYFYINVCNKSEEESKRTIRMSDGEPSAAFMTWLYSPYKRGM